MPRSGATTASTKVVYEELRARIVQGAYLPGERLPASELAQAFGTSRTPVREALMLLESDGLVVGELNRGYHVRPLSPDIIAQLYEMRAMLESFGARKAAEHPERLSDVDLERLWAAMDTLDELAEVSHHDDPDTIGRMMAANTFVHDTIIGVGGNPQLAVLISRTIDRGVIYRAFDLFSTQLLRRANEFHRMIVQRVLAGDVERAGAMMAEHVFQSRDVVLHAIDQHGGDVSRVFHHPARTDR